MAVQRVVLGKVAGPKGDTGPKGDKGNTGERGPLPIVQAEAGANIGVTGTPTVTTRNIEGGASFVFNYLKGEKGDPGQQGSQGLRGFSIGSVTRVTDPENTGGGEGNTYNVLLENGLSAGTFTVYNGQDGTDGNNFVITGEVSSEAYLPDSSQTEVGTAYFVGSTNPKDVYVLLDINGQEHWVNQGPLQGPQGDSAGFGTPVASVDANVGTPSVAITASGPNNAKVFNFAFHNLKGDKGDQGDRGLTGLTPILECASGPNINSVGTPSVTRTSDGLLTTTFTFNYLKGETGASGSSIQSITRTGGDGSAGSLDTYTITLTNGNTSTFTVQNGANGQAQSLTSISIATATTTNAEEEDEYGGTTYLGYKTASISLPNRAVFIGYGIYDSANATDPTTDDVKVVCAYEYQWSLGVNARIEIISANEQKDYYIQAYYYVS